MPAPEPAGSRAVFTNGSTINGLSYSGCEKPAVRDDSRRHNKISASEVDDASPYAPWRKTPHALTVEEEMLRGILREEISAALRDFSGMARNEMIPCETGGGKGASPEYWLVHQDGSTQSWLQQFSGRGQKPGATQTDQAASAAATEPVCQSARQSPDPTVEMPSWVAEPEYKIEPATMKGGTVDLGSMQLQEDGFAVTKNWMLHHEAPWIRSLVSNIGDAVSLLRHTEEPAREGVLAKVVESKWFDFLCAAVIVGNGACMYFRSNWDIAHPGSDVPLGILMAESFFMVYFGLELIVKILVHRLYFVIDPDNWTWNWFDALLVIVSVIQVARPNNAGNFMFMRMLRFLKTAKVLRVFRLMRFLSELRLILNSIIGSFASLFWSLLMMGMILYMFGLLFVQGTSAYLIDSHSLITDPENADLRACFGDVTTAMLSLFQVTTGGNDWSMFYEALAPLAWIHKTLFLFFIAFSQIALLNILTGIFVETAMKCAEPDKDSRTLEKQRANAADVKALTKLFASMDTDNSGGINITEFSKQLHIEGSALRMTFFELGLRNAEALQFFKLLSNHSGDEGVDIDSFVQGVLKLKGGATSLDMQAMHFQAKVLMKMLQEVKRDIKDVKAEQKSWMMEKV